MVKAIAFDTETTGLELYRGHKVFAWSIADEACEAEAYRIVGVNRKANRAGVARLQELFDDVTVAKVCHNLKFDLAAIIQLGIQIPAGTVFHDTMIMSQMLQNLEPSHALDRLCTKLCDYPTTNDELVKKHTRGHKQYIRVPAKIMAAYQRDDVIRTMLLYQLFWPMIQENVAQLADYQNEMALIPVTQRMESRGILLHRKNTETLMADLEEKVQDAYDEIHAITGEDINLNSGQQVADLLFNTLGMLPPKMTAKGSPSTDKSTLYALLEDYDHPALKALSRHRSYSHGLPIIGSYLDKADEHDVIHCTINTNRARTGRQSASQPNMQNVSKEQALANPYPIPARKCFRARVGFVNYHVDYAGIEMRLAINVSRDQAMVDLVMAEGDPHAAAAELFYGARFTEETDKTKKKSLRSAAKNGQFAIIYGASDKRLGETIVLPTAEARKAKLAYGVRFPEILGLSRKVSTQVKERGYVVTPFGRKLEVDRNKPYVGTNYLIQGTAAGVLKRAQVRVDKYLHEEGLAGRVNLLLPIHDELIIEYHRTLLHRRGEILNRISTLMTTFPEFAIPMAVEWKMTTTTWDRAKEVKI